jgi:uncharacterized protein YecA (UPF0149 family)
MPGLQRTEAERRALMLSSILVMAFDDAVQPRPRRRVGTLGATPWGRVGRNERCPCGSLKKFKRCCMPRPVRYEPPAEESETIEAAVES